MQDSGNGLLQKAIPLSGGLDLKTPRLLVEPGKLVDCLNYECIDIDGYKKIDGFERFDGGPSPSQTLYYGALTTSVTDPTRDGFRAGESGWLTGISDGVTYETRITYGTASIGGEAYVMTFIPEEDISTWAVSFGFESSDNFLLYNADKTDSEVIDSNAGFWTLSNDLANSLTVADTYRALVDALPDNAFPYAVQHYRDRAFVVANCRSILVAYDTTGSAPAVGDYTFYIGNVFRNGGSGGLEGIILDYRILRGSLEAHTTSNADRTWVRLLIYPTNAGTLTNDTVLNIDRVNATYTTPSVTCWKYYSAIDGNGPTDIDIWGGVLYKSLEAGSPRTSSNDWTQVDMGYEVEFDTGSSTIEPRELTLATTQEELDAESIEATGSPQVASSSFNESVYVAYENDAAGIAGWPVGGTTDQIALDGSGGSYDLSTNDGTGVVARQATGYWGSPTVPIIFRNLGLAIPEDAIVRGIKVDMECWFDYGGAVTANRPSISAKLTLPGSGERFIGTVSSISAASPTAITSGGGTDKWGLSEISPADLNSADFGLEMRPSVTSSSGNSYLLWDVFVVTVYYFRPVGKAIFWNAADGELESKLVRIHLDEGSWANGDAKGVMHIYEPEAAGGRNYIKPGDSFRISSNGTNIATVRNVRGSFLPSHADLVASDRRFQITRANYFLNTDWETLYGVHGLGRAWSYDNRYFRKIYTDYESSLDKPSHICSYRNYLVLGYPSGNLLLSAISGDLGPLPEEFRGTKGAREFSFVDHIHGLVELADTSLGVFCKSSIQRLVLNANAGDPASLFYQAVISKTSGCIEYTVATFGNNTLFCDQHGIRTLEQTDVYGDLIAEPLSAPVSPWLRQRLSQKKYWESTRTASQPVFAHTIKAKNQYRVWFNDGCVLCMNWDSKESPPQFTFLKYGFEFGGAFVPLVPIAYCNDTDDTITERLFVCHWNRNAGSGTAQNDATKFKYLFELERGWTFDGQDFPAKLTINLSSLSGPFGYEVIRKTELHGLHYGATTLFTAFGTAYSEEQSYSGMSFSETYVPSGTNPTTATVTADFVPFSKMTQVAARGRPLLMKVRNMTSATGSDATSAKEPPHILQALLVHYTPARNEV